MIELAVVIGPWSLSVGWNQKGKFKVQKAREQFWGIGVQFVVFKFIASISIIKE